MPQSAQEYKNLLTEVVRTQIAILGPDITLTKIRKVKGITVDESGAIAEVSGTPQDITNQLMEQFRDLSEEIIKKTMKPLMLRDQTEEPTVQTETKSKEVSSPAPVAEEKKSETEEPEEKGENKKE